MAIDPTIPLGIKTQSADDNNPLTTMGQVQDYKNKLLNYQVQQQQLQNSQLQNQTGRQQLSTTQNDAMGRLSLMQSFLPDSEQTPQAYTGLVDRMLQQGMIDANTASTWKQGIPANATPQQLRQMATIHGLALVSPEVAARMMAPHAGETLNQGGGLQRQTAAPVLGPQGGINPQAGTQAPYGAAVPTTLTPAEKTSTQPTIVNTPEGAQPGTVPVGSKYDEYGNAKQPGPMGTGRYGQTAGGAPPGFTPTGLPAGQDEDIKAYKVAQADVAPAAQRIAGLQKAYHALSLVNSGPGTGTWQEIRSTVKAIVGVDLTGDDTIANYDLARKYMQDYANRSSIGTTAQGIQASQHANASTDISQGAGLDVLRTNVGLERMGIAQTKLAPEGGQGFLKHTGNFATNYDRRGFSADMYSPDQLKKLVGGMKPDEKTRFFRSIGAAQRLGLMSPSGQQ